jgi:hypothetical protein
MCRLPVFQRRQGMPPLRTTQRARVSGPSVRRCAERPRVVGARAGGSQRRGRQQRTCGNNRPPNDDAVAAGRAGRLVRRVSTTLSEGRSSAAVMHRVRAAGMLRYRQGPMCHLLCAGVAAEQTVQATDLRGVRDGISDAADRRALLFAGLPSIELPASHQRTRVRTPPHADLI